MKTHHLPTLVLMEDIELGIWTRVRHGIQERVYCMLAVPQGAQVVEYRHG